jgi:hypothetical protein
METLRTNEQRAKNAITLIWIVLAVNIISLIFNYFQYDILQTVSYGNSISMDTATANDTRQHIIAIIYLITYFVSVVTFIQWFRRAYFNLHLKVDNLLQTESWAAVSWFIPIICLYRPFQIMKELYQETKNLLVRKEIPIENSFTTSYLGWWWALWIISNIMGQFVFRYTLRAKTLDELMISTSASMISDAISIPLAIITVKVIKDYSKVEPLLNEIKDDE